MIFSLKTPNQEWSKILRGLHIISNQLLDSAHIYTELVTQFGVVVEALDIARNSRCHLKLQPVFDGNDDQAVCTLHSQMHLGVREKPWLY